MVGGNVAVGVIGENLMVRLDREDAERALTEDHVRPMDFTGKPMKGAVYAVYVDSEGTASDDELAEWVEADADFAASLPPKSRK